MLLKLGKVLHGMQKEEKKKKGEEGFTLIELLVVVIIIGILAAIAIPVFLAQRERAQAATVQSDARNAGTAFVTCFADSNAAASCDTNEELTAYGFNPSADVTMGYVVTGDDIAATATHAGGPAATFNSATGQVTTT